MFALKNKRLLLFFFAFLFFLNILGWRSVYDLSKIGFLRIIFFEPPCNGTVLIITSKGRQILINSGSSALVFEKLAKEMPFWDRSLDLLIFTHLKQDYIKGSIEIFKKYKIENVLWTGAVRNNVEYQEWLKFLKKEKTKVKIAKFGQKITIDKVIFEILHPFEELEGKEVKNINDASIVMRLVFGENSFLFTGDISKTVEKKILQKEINLKSDFLEISRNGSKTASSEEFLENVLPEIAVISVDEKNPYGHPHQEVLERLRKYGVKILRTDQQGSVKIFSNGTRYKIYGKN